MKYILILVTFFLFVSGCGLSRFVSPNSNPVIEDRIQQKSEKEQIGTLALNPERRLLVTNLKNGKFCAEYPTETGLSQQSLKSFGALVKNAKGDSGKIEALTASMNRNQQLNRRSQSVQLFMAASYFLCQSYMNVNSGGFYEGNKVSDVKNDINYEKNLLDYKNKILEFEIDYINAQSNLYEAAFDSLKKEVKIFHESSSSIPDMLKDIGYELGVLKGALVQIENPNLDPDTPDPDPGTPNPDTPDPDPDPGTPNPDTPDSDNGT